MHFCRPASCMCPQGTAGRTISLWLVHTYVGARVQARCTSRHPLLHAHFKTWATLTSGGLQRQAVKLGTDQPLLNEKHSDLLAGSTPCCVNFVYSLADINNLHCKGASLKQSSSPGTLAFCVGGTFSV